MAMEVSTFIYRYLSEKEGDEDCDDSVLCLPADSAVALAWVIASVVLLFTISLFALRSTLSNQTSHSLNQLNELRDPMTELFNAFLRFFNIGYVLMILFLSDSIDEDKISFFDDETNEDVVVNMLLGSRIVVVLSSIGFVVLSVVSTQIPLLLATFSVPGATNNGRVLTSTKLSSYSHWSLVYLTSIFDLYAIKLIPWRATDFTFFSGGFPSIWVSCIGVLGNLVAYTMQFIAAMFCVPEAIAGARQHSTSYFLSFSGNSKFDEIVFWCFLLLSLMNWVGSVSSSAAFLHNFLSGRLQRVETKQMELVAFQKLSTSEEGALDSAENDEETTKPTFSPLSGDSNVSKRTSSASKTQGYLV